MKNQKSILIVIKHYNRQLIECFSYKGCIKITIYEDFTISDIEIYYILHLIWLDITILTSIKKFILNNIDLLSCKIYKKLIEYGLNINIWQKQIYYLWIKLGKNRYKYDKDFFFLHRNGLKKNHIPLYFKKKF